MIPVPGTVECVGVEFGTYFGELGYAKDDVSAQHLTMYSLPATGAMGYSWNVVAMSGRRYRFPVAKAFAFAGDEP